MTMKDAASGKWSDGLYAYGAMPLDHASRWALASNGPDLALDCNPLAFYPGYSADFFDNKHFVMKGGSARTAACMLRRSFRNWFQPHYPHVYAGFRCVSR